MSLAIWDRFRAKWPRKRQAIRRKSTPNTQSPSEDQVAKCHSSDNTLTHDVLKVSDVSEKSGQSTVDGVDSSLKHRDPSPDPASAGHDNPASADVSVSSAPEDVWTKAYKEAVQSLGEDVDSTLFKGDNVQHLFEQLGKEDESVTEGSSFIRGLKHLRSLQVPLERFKMALDFASPLASIEPTASLVFGVVRATTVLAVTVASADLDFAKMIGEMLEHISYIDGCDTLGQKTGQQDIHKALVLVYRDLLDFYLAAYKLLQQSGFKLLTMIMLKSHGLPDIVQEFMRHTEALRRTIERETLEIVEDIKNMLYDMKIDRWLGMSKYTAQSQFHNGLKEFRANEACAFILKEQAFLDWFQTSTTRQILVAGAMGSGKTNIMSFVVDELDRRKRQQLPQFKTCFHYCHRGDSESCTAGGVLSALILSLMEQLWGLKRRFVEWYQEAQADSSTLPSTSFDQLGRFLKDALRTQDRSIHFVIDGLDECDEHSQTELIRFFGDLSASDAKIKIVFSTRPQETILQHFGEGIARIDLVSNIDRDKAIASKVVDEKLYHLPAETHQLIAEKLASLSEGVAIWTTKIVDLIQVRKIYHVSSIHKFLEHIPLPGEMSTLYAELLKRYTSDEPENLLIATKALEVMIVARRPLSLLELSCAVAVAAAEEDFTTLVALEEAADFHRVLTLINPFIRPVNYKEPKLRQVQLAHASVRDFLLQGSDTLSHNPPARSSLAREVHARQRVADLEVRMANICISYLLLDEIGSRPLFSETQAAFEALPQETDLFSEDLEPEGYDPLVSWEVWEASVIRYDPSERGFGEFFVYASTYWIWHLESAQRLEQVGLERIQTLCEAGSLRLGNWIEQNRRPDCAIQPRFVFDASLYDPLSIACLYGSAAFLEDLIRTSGCSGSPYLPDSGMNAVDQLLKWGDVSRLRLLRSTCLAQGLALEDLELFRRAMWQWRHANDSIVRDWDTVFDMIDSMPDEVVAGDWGDEALSVAKRLECTPVLERLERNGKV